jgi:hypothetical protein
MAKTPRKKKNKHHLETRTTLKRCRCQHHSPDQPQANDQGHHRRQSERNTPPSRGPKTAPSIGSGATVPLPPNPNILDSPGHRGRRRRGCTSASPPRRKTTSKTSPAPWPLDQGFLLDIAKAPPSQQGYRSREPNQGDGAALSTTTIFRTWTTGHRPLAARTAN